MKLGFYLFAEYTNMFMSCTIMATLYFIRYDIPFLNESTLDPNLAGILGIIALFAKSFFLIFVLCGYAGHYHVSATTS